ncbi:MAG: T9SS type A sorting domain-containing protein, partial [Flavobacterium sp.]|nr:T9SS type A sorting domain-containing protein [Flavobacterium sp.]
TAYTEYWAIWIDFNQNGTFETSELAVSGSSSSSANLTGTITVPTSALVGNTRMRVSMKYNAAQTACETFSYGEVEDYTVTIGGTAITSFVGDVSQIGNEGNVFEFDMYPNPTNNVLNIAMADNRKASYVIYNFMGQKLKADANLQSEINVSDLAAGVYVLEVNDGQKSIAKKFIKN